MSIFGFSYPAGAANDPFAPYNQNDDSFGQEQSDLISALHERSTNRWRWDRIHCCLTGKDADLGPSGQQGVEIVGVINDVVKCIAHIGYTIVGDDVCINTPSDAKPELIEQAIEAYLKQAGTLVADGGLKRGEWTGDDWYQYDAIPFECPLVLDSETDQVRIAETASAVLLKAEEVLASSEARITEIDLALNTLAGWKALQPDGEPTDCLEGQPGPQSIWAEIFACQLSSAPATADDNK